MNRSVTLFSVLAASAVLVAGCGDAQDGDVPVVLDSPATTEAPAAGSDLASQPQADDLQSRLVGHMSVARAADARGFRQFWPEHEGLVREMLADCRQMMRQMGMTPPSQFTSVETALESDLERIPDLNNAELESLLPDHLDRVQAVIDMRQEMMDDMS
jgi:hypothetical protein